MTIERMYRLTLPFDAVDRASTAPPLEPARRALGYAWRFDEAQFDRIPELRRWIAAETEVAPEEEGFVRRGVRPGSLSLVTGTTPSRAAVTTDPRTVDVCPVCGTVTVRLTADAHLTVVGELLSTGVLYLSAIDAFAAPVGLVDALVEAGLAEGLETLDIAGGTHRLLAATTNVGEPVAAFGTTGVTCATCGRPGLRVGDRTFPGLPRYSFYYLYERPETPAQWVWSTIDGQTRPMVTSDVAEWLAARDPTINLQRRGWYPDEVELAFLDETYR